MKTVALRFSLSIKLLSVFRVLVGLLVFGDFLALLNFHTFLIGEASIITQSMAKEYWFKQPGLVSGLLSMLPTSLDLMFQALILTAIGVGAILTIAGWFHRSANILLTVSYICLVSRWPHFSHSGDSLMIWVFIWTYFLPWDQYRLDKKLRFLKSWKQSESHVFSFATVAFYLQVVLFFTLAGFNKFGSTWMDGTAVGLATKNLNMVTPLGLFFNINGDASKVLSYFTLFTELVAPLLILLPLRSFVFRRAGIGLLSLLMFGLCLFFYTGTMAPLGMFLLIPLLTVPETEREVFLDKHSCTRKVTLAVVVSLAISSYASNFRRIPKKYRKPISKVAVGNILALRQNWNMYAPDAPPYASTVLFSVMNSKGQKHYLSFFDLKELTKDRLYSDTTWYQNFIRYRRMQKLYENTFFGGLRRREAVLHSLVESICQRIESKDVSVGIDFWIKSLVPPHQYLARPILPSPIPCQDVLTLSQNETGS